MGFCVIDPCYMVVCAPDPTTNEPRTCVDGDCLTLCETVTCTAPLVCRPSDGLCVEDNCNGFPERCDAGEFCVDGVCEVDPCATVECPDPETYCLNGTCVDSCGAVDCPPGQTCRLGVCEDDPCAGVDCPSFQVCDPATGDCVQDDCIGIVCPSGMICDPQTGDCARDPCLGVECPGNEVCREGSCYDPNDLPGAPDGGMPPNTYVSAGGAGGCSCDVGSSGGAGGAWAGVILLALGLVLMRRRSR
jgi:MYXO-CTERM domain-containing protein